MYQNTCLVCGVPISKRSKRCRKHNIGGPRKHPRSIVCPDCGGRKAQAAAHCRNCARKHYKYTKQIERRNEPSADLAPLPKEWIYQFVGLFYGEGSVTIAKTNKGTYYPSMTLGMRVDDSPIVEDMMRKIGGHYHIAKQGSSHPMFRWQCNRLHEVLDLCRVFLEHTIIPARKEKEIRILLAFCEWRSAQHFHLKDWAPAIEFQKQIQAAKRFKQG